MALVKAEFAGDRRLFELEERTYECLMRSLENVFGPGIASVKFLDGDGDWITIDRSEELVLAFRIVDPPLRIQVSKAADTPVAVPVPSEPVAGAAVVAEAVPASFRIATQRLQERGVEVTATELFSFMQLLRLNAKRFVKVSLLSNNEIESDEGPGSGGTRQAEDHMDEDDEVGEEYGGSAGENTNSDTPSNNDGAPNTMSGAAAASSSSAVAAGATSTTSADANMTDFVPPMLVAELANQGVRLSPQTIHGLIVNLRIRPRRFVRCNLLPKHLAKSWNAARKDLAGGRHGHCHRMRGGRGRRHMGTSPTAAASMTSGHPSPTSSQEGHPDPEPVRHGHPRHHSFQHVHDHHHPHPSHQGHPHHPHHHPHHHLHQRHHPFPPFPGSGDHGHPRGGDGHFGRGRGRCAGHARPDQLHHNVQHGHRFPPHHTGFIGRMARAEVIAGPVVSVQPVHVEEHGHGNPESSRHGNATPSPHTQPSNRVKARFVSHLTFPDKAKVRRNTLFTKSWLVRNDHSTPWPENTQLIPVGVSARLFGVNTAVRAPASIAPGETVEVSVNLMAPNEPGMYEAYFRLCDGVTGQKFGQRLWLNVNVGEEDDADERTNEATGHMAAAVALDALDGFDLSSFTSPVAPVLPVGQP